ncbi:hypothetical protein D9611_002223 [Ephemerocybe angulata]|uniref:Uncharacterized protein n=1 Tax=Ephemerocybe angulata TaxID=980116 RepID=A0A8H5FE95_9AGAR|nr:hypothetical protein D9611_002223 [Tulosesus angulatus]
MPVRPSSHSVLKSVSTTKAASSLLPKPHNVRRLTANATRNTPVAVPALARFVATSAPPPSPAVKLLFEKRYADLKRALYIDGSPTRVWNSYTDLLNSSGFQTLPIEIHQEVLRRCTPPAQEIRIASARRKISGAKSRIPHLHEGRFQAIIRNIQISRGTPTLEDYHFVLEQFAAVGNYIGSVQVYNELKGVNHTPTAKTFGLILQAIAHRFTLHIHKAARLDMVRDARKVCDQVLADMKELDVPIVPANIDLTLRVLKETMDYEAFEGFMRWAYGIDLAYPDRIPLELLERKSSATTQHLPVPFTTHALNTTIDFLGRLGNMSKMIQAFEVLTQPLPHAEAHFFSSFEEDEEDVGAVLNGPRPSFTPPTAQPNSTTYSLLIRHAAQARNGTLARHYLNEAFWLNRQVSHRLRHATFNIPNAELQQPTFMLNRHMIIPVVWFGDSDKKYKLLSWLRRKLPEVIRLKESELDHHIRRHAHHEMLAGRTHPASVPPASPAPTTSPSSAVPASSPSDASPTQQSPDPIFDLDFDSTRHPSPSAPKPFNPELHISLLQRDVEELVQVSERVDFLLSRTAERIKERLGRRVWAKQNIYLGHVGQRRVVTKTKWAEIVNFRDAAEQEESRPAESTPSERQEQTVESSPRQEIQSPSLSSETTSDSTARELPPHMRGRS